MIKVIQTTSLINGTQEEDFQSRMFEYESFEKLISDFESRDDIRITKSNIIGNLRPRGSRFEVLKKDNFHAMYRVKTKLGGLAIDRFYAC